MKTSIKRSGLSLGFAIAICLAIASLSQPICLAQTPEPTYAERLGWPEGAKVVIFHIDDAGMCHDANLGTIEALENGVSTSTSIMMPCSWVPEFAAYLKEHPDVDAGIHLTLTSEWDNYRWGPLAGKAAVPSLCDAQGCLWGNVQDVLKHGLAEEVEVEIRAQIDRALEMGLKPTHLDSHMATLFTSPLFFHRYMKVGIDTGIPILVPGGHLQFIAEDMPELAPQVRHIARQVWEAGLPAVDDIVAATYDWKSFEDKKAKTINVLRTMKPGITEIIQHCTRPTEVFEQISTSSETRLSDLRVSLDPEIREVIKQEGIVLTTWRELKERRDAMAVTNE